VLDVTPDPCPASRHHDRPRLYARDVERAKEAAMSTSTQTLPVRRSAFTAVWIALVAAVIVAAVVLGIAFMRSPAATSGTPNRPASTVQQTDGGKAKPYQPIKVDGQVCGQCR
jgi:hypothetical protein